MRSFSAAVPIRAPKDEVWAILTKASSYHDWNPTIKQLEGVIAEGASLRLVPTDPYEKFYSVVVSELSVPNKMVWRRSMPLGSFVGTRTFRLRTLKDGSVEFDIREVYTGWLAGWLRKTIPEPQKSFEVFAVALKQRAEAPPAVTVAEQAAGESNR